MAAGIYISYCVHANLTPLGASHMSLNTEIVSEMPPIPTLRVLFMTLVSPTPSSRGTAVSLILSCIQILIHYFNQTFSEHPIVCRILCQLLLYVYMSIALLNIRESTLRLASVRSVGIRKNKASF